MRFWTKENGRMADIPFAPITIGDRKIEVAMEWVKGKSMTARLKNGRIQIRIPQHLGKNAALPHADMLLGRLTKRILKDPERYLGRKIKRLVFKGPGRLTLMGRPLEITIEESGRLHKRAKIWGENGAIKVILPKTGESEPDLEGWSPSISRFIIAKSIRELEGRVNDINSNHYRSRIGSVKIKDIYSRWGSCKIPANDLVFNFKLLFMPLGVLDYVIAHELAHTKVKNHGKRFWETVKEASPDYAKHRRWLRLESEKFLEGQGF